MLTLQHELPLELAQTAAFSATCSEILPACCAAAPIISAPAAWESAFSMSRQPLVSSKEGALFIQEAACTLIAGPPEGQYAYL